MLLPVQLSEHPVPVGTGTYSAIIMYTLLELSFINFYIGSKSTCQKIRRLYSDCQKLKVAEYARHHGTRCAASHFGVPVTNVARWLTENIDKVPLKPAKCKRKNKKGQRRKVSYHEHIEEQLEQWILEKREESFTDKATYQ